MASVGDELGVPHLTFDTRRVDAAMREFGREIDNATKAALRAAGRKWTQAARRQAPVYSGDDPRAEPGRLKKSIHQSKRFRRHGEHDYSIFVGPMGGVVNLYRGKIEARDPFMSTTHGEAQAAMWEAAQTAYAKAIAKARS